MATLLFGFDLEAPLPLIGVSLWSLIVAGIILLVGHLLVRAAVKALRKAMLRAGLSKLLSDFLARSARYILYLFVIGTALGVLGIDVGAALISVSVVLGFVLGFALNETLSNVAAGVMIALFPPFREGDYVEIAGKEGTVQKVGVNVTELLTLDNHHVVIPNRVVWGSVIVNYTRMPIRRTVIPLRIGYEENLGRALRAIKEAIDSHPKVLKDPSPAVVVTSLGSSGVEIDVRVWARTEDLWDMRAELICGIKEALDREGIKVAYQTLNVHVQGES